MLHLAYETGEVHEVDQTDAEDSCSISVRKASAIRFWQSHLKRLLFDILLGERKFTYIFRTVPLKVTHERPSPEKQMSGWESLKRARCVFAHDENGTFVVRLKAPPVRSRTTHYSSSVWQVGKKPSGIRSKSKTQSTFSSTDSDGCSTFFKTKSASSS